MAEMKAVMCAGLGGLGGALGYRVGKLFQVPYLSGKLVLFGEVDVGDLVGKGLIGGGLVYLARKLDMDIVSDIATGFGVGLPVSAVF